MAETLNDIKWQLKVAKSVAGRKDMSTVKKNEWKRRARVLERKKNALEKHEKRRERLKKH